MNARALFKDSIFLFAAILTLVFLAGFWWFLFVRGAPSPSAKTKAFTHMHCPNCRDEIRYSPNMVGKKCTSCDRPGVFVPTVGSIDDEANQDSGFGRFVLFGLTALIVLQGLTFLGISRHRRHEEIERQIRNRMLVAACPFCGRKVSYPVSKAGDWATCVKCKTAFALPDPVSDGPASRHA